MGEYVGLDVSLKETAVSIRRAGKRIWRGKCASDPQILAALIRKHAAVPERVTNCERTSPTSWPPTTLPAGSKRSAASRPTNTSPRSGRQSQTGSSLIRSTRCRD